jgi:hypothetical protein
VSYADAVTREAAWLAQSGDGLPALLKSAGGPFDIIRAYWPGNRLATQQTGIYVTRGHISANHSMALRYRPQCVFRIKVVWPVRCSSRIAEIEQQNLDDALDALITRISGPPGDKTHGGRFLSVAELPQEGSVMVDFEDPEATIQATKDLRCTIGYYADDLEFTG